ncbi:hypothetical protein GCM10028778_19400 [Barrientosiimonas marina]|uniref:Uncharacterized protein n=1 Tax=Lentibacillus kimchii TaxID=1542911 RepID=A0ABW2URV5_9BACI
MRSYLHKHFKIWLSVAGALILILAGSGMVWAAFNSLSSSETETQKAANSEMADPDKKAEDALPEAKNRTDPKNTETAAEKTKENQKQAEKNESSPDDKVGGRSASSDKKEAELSDQDAQAPAEEKSAEPEENQLTSEEGPGTVSSSRETGDTPSGPTEPTEPSMSSEAEGSSQHDRNADEEDDFLSGDPAGENGIGEGDMPEFHVPQR